MDDSTGIPYIKGSCTSWGSWAGYGFKVKWANEANYMLVPISAFLTYDSVSQTCQMKIQRLDPEAEDSANIVFGALFLA